MNKAKWLPIPSYNLPIHTVMSTSQKEMLKIIIKSNNLVKI